MNETLRDYRIYTDSMAHSVWDKSFFMDKIEGTDAIIDCGCADGAMIRFLSGIFPEMQFYGYDIDPQMIVMARSKNMNPSHVHFFAGDELDALILSVKKHNAQRVCLNLSSVLHEIYSFNSGRDNINRILLSLPVRYITIRDMYFHTDVPELISRPKNILDRCDKEYIKQFEGKYGRIDTWMNTVHFLMKYQWIDNGWEEEMKENYFSWTLPMFMNDIFWSGTPVFEAHYLLPHLCYRWWKEYSIFIPRIHTHAQFVLKGS